MDALASAGDLAGCQKLLDAMATHGVVPSAVIWNAFLKARLASPRDGLEVRAALPCCPPAWRLLAACNACLAALHWT